jgi:hypothetical protein
VKYLALFALLVAMGASAQPWPSDDSLKAGLVGWWTFNEGTGTVAKDYSGTGNSATLIGSPIWKPGAIGSAINLNGSSQYINVFGGSSLGFSGDITLAAWCFITNFSIGGDLVIARDNNSTGQRGYFIGFNSDSTPSFSVFKATDVESNLKGPAPSVLNKWIHIAGTYHFVADGTSQMTLYINGVLNTNISTAVGPRQTTTNDCHIGHRQYSGFTYYVGGMVDDPRIYNRALSAAEVAGLYWEVASQWKQGP